MLCVQSLVGIEHYGEPNRTWHQLLSAVPTVKGLRCVRFGPMPATVLQSMCASLNGVQELSATDVLESVDEPCR